MRNLFSALFEELSPTPTTIYHISPTANESSILENGLVVGSARSTCGKETQKKIYLTESIEDIDNPFPHHEHWTEKSMSVYEVNSVTLKLEKDPEYPDGCFYMHEGDIPPSLLKPLGRHVFTKIGEKYSGYKHSGE